MCRCRLTITYLRSELSACSAVWLLFGAFFPKFITFLMQRCKNILLKAFQNWVYTFFQSSRLASEPLFVSVAVLRLSATVSFRLKMTISNVFSSNFGNLTA